MERQPASHRRRTPAKLVRSAIGELAHILVPVLLPSRSEAFLPDYFDGVADQLWIGAQQEHLFQTAWETRMRSNGSDGARAGCRCAARGSDK